MPRTSPSFHPDPTRTGRNHPPPPARRLDRCSLQMVQIMIRPQVIVASDGQLLGNFPIPAKHFQRDDVGEIHPILYDTRPFGPPGPLYAVHEEDGCACPSTHPHLNSGVGTEMLGIEVHERSSPNQLEFVDGRPPPDVFRGEKIAVALLLPLGKTPAFVARSGSSRRRPPEDPTAEGWGGGRSPWR